MQQMWKVDQEHHKAFLLISSFQLFSVMTWCAPAAWLYFFAFAARL